ncbi:hypothetical protein ACTJKO_05505 [Curtobacterium sp. 22159]|uniref:hypothetical protein n=1 Tax=Curtobacterium sp. 22159 TaxID=3453882 RepID=UPI003F84C753
MALLLGIAAGVFWLVALTVPICVLLIIGNLPGDDPARTERSFVIAFGAFLNFALLAAPATIGFLVVRRAGARSGSAGAR